MRRKSIVKHPQTTSITTDVVYMFATILGGGSQGRYAPGTLRPHEFIRESVHGRSYGRESQFARIYIFLA
jgi:hypothetical protein